MLTKVLKKLDEKKQDKPDWKAICFPAGGQSLTYARGDSLTVETTALAVLAMLKTGQFTNSVNKALTYLIKSQGRARHLGQHLRRRSCRSRRWSPACRRHASTRATTPFTILVNGKEAAKGKVTEENADVLQLFDLKEHLQAGRQRGDASRSRARRT